MNLNTLSLEELRALSAKVSDEIKARQSQEINKAREEIFAIAKSVGRSVAELFSTKPASKPVAPRYSHPANPQNQWTGRGRAPKWVKEWIEGGKSLDQLRIEA